jgi:hypothetical protein
VLGQPQPRLLGLWLGCKLLGGFCTLHGLCGESLLLGLALISLQVDALPFKGDPAVLCDPCRTIIADPRLCNSSLLVLHLLVLKMRLAVPAAAWPSYGWWWRLWNNSNEGMYSLQVNCFKELFIFIHRLPRLFLVAL